MDSMFLPLMTMKTNRIIIQETMKAFGFTSDVYENTQRALNAFNTEEKGHMI